MHKLAIFVEGQTEEVFVRKLVEYLGHERNLGIRVERASGGSRHNPRRAIQIFGTSEEALQDYFILIVNCAHDERVKSDIVERYDGLIAGGYQAILGIRDVAPHAREKIRQLRDGLQYRLPMHPVVPIFVLEIMEIEAWFLAEHSHFPRLHPRLTVERIAHEFGFHPAFHDMQLRDHPAKDLEDIYFLEAIDYRKTRQHAERTVDSLDFRTIAQELVRKIDDLKDLVEAIASFFDSSLPGTA